MYRIGEATVKHIGNGGYEITARKYRDFIEGTPAAVRCDYRSGCYGLKAAINAAIELTLWLQVAA
jgi:hypothetical protein